MISLPSPQQLRYLVALAEQRHFGRAASACAVTQIHPVGRGHRARAAARRRHPRARAPPGGCVPSRRSGWSWWRGRGRRWRRSRPWRRRRSGARADDRAAAPRRDPDDRPVPAAAADAGAARGLPAAAALAAGGPDGPAGGRSWRPGRLDLLLLALPCGCGPAGDAAGGARRVPGGACRRTHPLAGRAPLPDGGAGDRAAAAAGGRALPARARPGGLPAAGAREAGRRRSRRPACTRWCRWWRAASA